MFIATLCGLFGMASLIGGFGGIFASENEDVAGWLKSLGFILLGVVLLLISYLILDNS